LIDRAIRLSGAGPFYCETVNNDFNTSTLFDVLELVAVEMET
jgi:hypothetical protein